MPSEKDFENIICKYPELIEDGLILKGRQISLYGRRMDILFEDKFKRKLIIELKVGPIKDEHIGQVLSYEGMFLSADDPTIRIMLVGNRVPPNIQKSLDHHGIAWKEIAFSRIKDHLLSKNDTELVRSFDEPIQVSKHDMSKPKEIAKVNYDILGKKPALFVPIERRWIDLAFDCFKKGQENIYFYTNSNVSAVANLEVESIYFKIKGNKEIQVKANFIDLVEELPKSYRLPGHELPAGKYYYGYNGLRWLKKTVDLTDLKYFKTQNNLRTDVPGSCLIIDPEVE